jgi:hypothetical protein
VLSSLRVPGLKFGSIRLKYSCRRSGVGLGSERCSRIVLACAEWPDQGSSMVGSFAVTTTIRPSPGATPAKSIPHQEVQQDLNVVTEMEIHVLHEAGRRSEGIGHVWSLLRIQRLPSGALAHASDRSKICVRQAHVKSQSVVLDLRPEAIGLLHRPHGSRYRS